MKHHVADFQAHILNRLAVLRAMPAQQALELTDADLADIAAEHERLIQLERHIVDLRRLLRRVGLR